MSLMECTTAEQVRELAQTNSRRVLAQRVVPAAKRDKAQSVPVAEKIVEAAEELPYVGAEEAAVILGVSPSAIREWCRDQAFGYKVFGKWRVPLARIGAQKQELKVAATACIAAPPADSELRLKLRRARDLSRGFDTINNIKRIVCAYYLVTEGEITGPRRDPRLIKARHVAIYLASTIISQFSYGQIAEHFGNRDHSSMINAVNRIRERRESDPQLRAEVTKFETMIREVT